VPDRIHIETALAILFPIPFTLIFTHTMRAVSILSFLALGSFTAAAQVESRSSPSESYSLYAYGEGVGGFALYYNEG
jgi:hypothetical protein